MCNHRPGELVATSAGGRRKPLEWLFGDIVTTMAICLPPRGVRALEPRGTATSIQSLIHTVPTGLETGVTPGSKEAPRGWEVVVCPEGASRWSRLHRGGEGCNGSLRDREAVTASAMPNPSRRPRAPDPDVRASRRGITAAVRGG
jgi:hypothetical protein